MPGREAWPVSKEPDLPELHLRLRAEVGRIDAQLHAMLAAMDRLQGLLDAVVTISREVELPGVLHRIVTTAMDPVGARHGALGVLDGSDGDQDGHRRPSAGARPRRRKGRAQRADRATDLNAGIPPAELWAPPLHPCTRPAQLA
jgi:hypothetical protein